MSFELHPNFSSKIFLVDLPLCRVLLENEQHYPWLMLVPKRPNVSKIMDLSFEDQMELIHELDLAQNVLWELFHPTQLNVAAIGNKTPQLHIHVIARFKDDPAWPNTVWDHPAREKYSSLQLNEVSHLLRNTLEIRKVLLTES
jgi:diadenosine tetraphosphate (Ap4A) HIT family hydrolase